MLVGDHLPVRRHRPVADHLRVRQPGPGDDGVTGIRLPFAPAGTALLDRVFGVGTRRRAGRQRARPVSAPTSYDADGAVVDTVPLRDGAGTGPLTDSTGTSVRIVDEPGTSSPRSSIEALG